MDTPDFELREKKVAMRIRTFENWAELTLKANNTWGLWELQFKMRFGWGHSQTMSKMFLK